MEKIGSNSKSALPAIASHERELMQRLEESVREADRIRAAARVEAGRIAEQAAETLANEIARIRSEGEAHREAERVYKQKQAELKLDRMRIEAQARTAEAVRNVIVLVLPQK